MEVLIIQPDMILLLVIYFTMQANAFLSRLVIHASEVHFPDHTVGGSGRAARHQRGYSRRMRQGG